MVIAVAFVLFIIENIFKASDFYCTDGWYYYYFGFLGAMMLSRWLKKQSILWNAHFYKERIYASVICMLNLRDRSGRNMRGTFIVT